MKKIRISLRDSSKKWSVPLYDSLTSYLFMHDHSKSKSSAHRNLITLSKSEYLEIEWLGADYCHIDELGMFLNEKTTREEMLQRCDHVRIGKCVRKSGRRGFDYVCGYKGYVPGGLIPWNIRAAPSFLKVIELKGRFKPRIDFSELFEDKDDPCADFLLEAAEEAGIC